MNPVPESCFARRVVYFVAVVTLVMVFATGARAGGQLDVRHFGAVGDGRADDTSNIQKAVDACAAAGGGVIHFGPGHYLSKPLFLHGNNVELHLDAGAVLQGSQNFGDYVPGRSAKGVPGLINAEHMTNVSITGEGIIDGGGAPWWPAVREAKRQQTAEPRLRPKMVNFRHCAHVTIRGVTLRNSPSFHLVPADCEDVLIDGVSVLAPGDSPNTDAIDPSACRRVRIVNCTLDVGDDNVAVKAGGPGGGFCCQDILVSNCLCLHGHGVSIGSETSGGVSNFTVADCKFDGTVSGLRIKTNRERGGRIVGVVARHLTMRDVKTPINITCYYPKVPDHDSAQPVTATTPVWRNILIEDVDAETPSGAGTIIGLPESFVREVTLKNVRIKAATGLRVRNAEGIHLDNVKIKTAKGEPVIWENGKP